jgi:hypothetical protein
MRPLILLALLSAAILGHTHVHQWRLIDKSINDDGDTVCSWLCDHTGIEYRMVTTGCWNPND